MKTTSWKDIAELIGIAAILLGLFLVYQEIKLNGTIVRAELSAETSRNLARLKELILDPDIAGAYLNSMKEPESLTEVQRLQVNFLLENVLRQYRRECFYASIGIFQECESNPRSTALKFFHKNPMTV